MEIENFDLDFLDEIDSPKQEETKEEPVQEPVRETPGQKVEEFLISTKSKEENLTLEFAKRYLNLEKQIKELKDDQKQLKKDAKDDGIAVAKVNQAINQLKRLAKTKPEDLTELEFIQEILASDIDIKAAIDELVQPE